MAKDSDRQIITFDDFRGGEAGTLHGLEAAPPNSFTGTNVVVFKDGSIGPRSGLYLATPTGQSNGKISILGFTGVPGGEFWYAQGTNIYQFSPGGARSAAYTGTIASPTSPPDMSPGTNRYLMVPGDKTYELNHVAKTCTALTGSPAGRCVAEFGSRVYVGATGPGNRIRYSADANPNDWTVGTGTGHAGQFDVGNSNQDVRGMYVLRDSLVIVMADASVWVLTANGDPVDTGTLRQVSTYQNGGAIWQPMRAHVVYGWELWSVGLHTTAPQVFNGGRQRWLDHLGTSNVDGAANETGVWADSLLQTNVLPPEYGVMSIDDTVVMVGGSDSRALTRIDNVWTKHEFEQTIVGYINYGNYGAVVLTDGGDTAAAPKFYTFNTASGVPPIKGGGVKLRDSVGDGSDTPFAAEFTTPVWYDKQGRRAHVRGVIVDFRAFNTGVAANDKFTVTVMGEYGLDGAADSISAPQSWSAAPAGFTTTGVRRSMRFGFGDQAPGYGFQIKLSELVGVTIDRIRVIVDLNEGLAI